MLKIAFFLASICLVLAACSVGENEVNTQLCRFLGISFASDFRIVKSDHSVALNNNATTVDVIFNEKGLLSLEAVLKKEITTQEAGSVQFYKVIEIGGGEDYLLMQHMIGSNQVHIQYGHD